MTRLGWRRGFRRALSRVLRPVEFWLRRQILFAVDTLVLLRPSEPDDRKVLLARLDNIGDFTLWLDAARATAEHYREQAKEVTLLGSASWAAWAEDLGLFDKVLALDQERFKRDLPYRFAMGRQIRRNGFGTAVQPTCTRIPEMGDAVVRVSGALTKIGAAGLAARASDRLYTQLISVEGGSPGELQRNAAFVRGLTGKPFAAKLADMRDSVRSPSKEPTNRTPASPYFVLFPGASAPGRKWPVASFAALARRIHDQTGWHGLICGGRADAADAERMVDAAGPALRSMAGQTSLAELAGLLAGAKLLVSNETSAVHMAATLGVPTVCLLGGGHFGRFLPYEIDIPDERPLPRMASHRMECFGCDWSCKFHPERGQPMPCIEQITVEAAWREVAALLPDRPNSLIRLQISPANSIGNPTKDEAEVAVVGIGVQPLAQVTCP